jgi:hypothetical protein
VIEGWIFARAVYLALMKAHVGLVFLCAVLAASGCNKNSGSPPPSNTVGNNPINAPAEYGGALVKAQTLATKTADLTSLNNAVQQYNALEGHLPKSLEELVSGHYIGRLPAAPIGMRLTYDEATGRVGVAPK